MATHSDRHSSRSVFLRAHLPPAVLGVAIGVLLLAQPFAAEKTHFDSHPRDGAVAIDGKFDDWTGHLDPLGSTLRSIQVLNDGEFLYLRMTASDSGTRMEIMRLGMTVWFDPAG